MCKKILLIAPLSEQYSGIKNYGVPSIGVHRLASFLNANGQDVTVYDCNIHNLEDFLNTTYDYIGISILNNTLVLSLELIIKLQKRFPNTPIICGNAESTVNYETIFYCTDVEMIITGEGELPMLELCNGKPIEEIKGIIHRKHGEPITDNLLWEYYKDLDFGKMQWNTYFDKNLELNPESKDKVIRLVTSSHCRQNCTFCSLTTLHKFSCGKSVKPAVLTGEQIKILIQRAKDQIVGGITHVYFVEDCILPFKERIDDFCYALKAFPDLKYLVQSETTKMNQEVLKKLADSNVIHCSYGVENCSIKVRKAMGKPQNEQHLEDLIGWSYELGIKCYYLIILFSPEVTIDDLIINYNTLTRWQSDKRVITSCEPFMMPYKMSRIYNRLHEFQWEQKVLSNGKIIKYPTYILPDDPQAREIMLEMQKELPDYINEKSKKLTSGHQSKNYTGEWIIELLGDKLKQKKYL